MKFKNVLLLYKKSAYKIYFLERKSIFHKKGSPALRKVEKRFKQAHTEHYDTLKKVTQVLIENNINFTEAFRGQRINYKKYDLIITVGGDGTFLEAAHNSRHQVILGVNSAPSYSVGSFCIANTKNFPSIIKRILDERFKVGELSRLRLKFSERQKPIEALNDILICHENPAMLCRYSLKVGRISEEQRSSGIWITTPAGSSGAIKSAGGKVTPKFSKELQYKPRELYPMPRLKYKLKGGVVSSTSEISITSLMRKGVIYADGAHWKTPFEHGRTAKITLSPHPTKTILLS